MSDESSNLPSLDDIHSSTDVLFDLGTTRVIAVGDIVVKYGEGVALVEAETMAFITERTTIPIPKVLGTLEHDGKVYIYMERVQGRTMQECLTELKDDELVSVAEQLSDIVTQLRAIESSHIGSINGPCTDYLWKYNTDLEKGPFGSERQFNDTIVAFYHERYPGKFSVFLRSLYLDNHRIMFTHSDLTPRNIMINDGRIVAILDWEFAGWYPEYWEFVKALYGDEWQTEWPLLVDKKFPMYHYELMLHNMVYTALT
jgi:serine/threonine protein kinase